MTTASYLAASPNAWVWHDPQCGDSTWDHDCPVTPPAWRQLDDVAKCPNCGRQSRSYSRGCSECGFGRPVVPPPAPVVVDTCPECRKPIAQHSPVGCRVPS